MGLWSGIKRAINSTLGTNEFKPLDKIITGEKRFVSGDSVIVSDFKLDRKTIFKTKIPGVITFKFTAAYSGSSGYNDYTLNLYNSSLQQVGSKSFRLFSSQGTQDISISFDIYGNDEYSIDMYYNTSTTDIGTISLCANILDYNYFKVENV